MLIASCLVTSYVAGILMGQVAGYYRHGVDRFYALIFIVSIAMVSTSAFIALS